MRLTCNVCDGEGGWTEIIDWELGGPYTQCYICHGEGTITLWKRLNMWFWENSRFMRLQEWYIDYYDWRHPRKDWGWKDGEISDGESDAT